MSEHYKALIIVMSITLIGFRLCRPIVAAFIPLGDFQRRRNIWICLVVAAYLVSNFWLYMLIAAGLLGYGFRRDPNPTALYFFLLLAIPPFGRDIPTFGLISQVFPLDYLRLLSFMILLPAWVRLLRRPVEPESLVRGMGSTNSKWLATDALVVGFCALQVLIWFPYDSSVATLRRVFLFAIDVLLPYFVFSRSCRRLEDLSETMASLLIAAIALSGIAIFEASRSWLLFATLEETWETLHVTQYLRRGSTLRAQATGGHSLVLGYALMLALGCWFGLRSQLPSARMRWGALAALIVGLVATMARGPWIGAIAVWLTFTALGPRGVGGLLKASMAMALVFGVMLLTPWGADAIDKLPFIGTQEDSSVSYRQRLASVSWMLIQQNPIFGSLHFMGEMEELRQGEGIIDLVNTYAGIALAYGLVGVSLFAGIFIVAGTRSIGAARQFAPSNPAAAQLGTALAACLLAAMVVLATVSMYLSVAWLTWAIAGLNVAYAQIMRRELPA